MLTDLKKKIEQSKDPYVLFQAVQTIKEAALREWSLLSFEFSSGIEMFLMRYAVEHCNMLAKKLRLNFFV